MPDISGRPEAPYMPGTAATAGEAQKPDTRPQRPQVLHPLHTPFWPHTPQTPSSPAQEHAGHMKNSEETLRLPPRARCLSLWAPLWLRSLAGAACLRRRSPRPRSSVEPPRRLGRSRRLCAARAARLAAAFCATRCSLPASAASPPSPPPRRAAAFCATRLSRAASRSSCRRLRAIRASVPVSASATPSSSPPTPLSAAGLRWRARSISATPRCCTRPTASRRAAAGSAAAAPEARTSASSSALKAASILPMAVLVERSAATTPEGDRRPGSAPASSSMATTPTLPPATPAIRGVWRALAWGSKAFGSTRCCKRRRTSAGFPSHAA
mmetsp:Transcript_139226/g.388534  ORF Transcript_139226/g.388534 Transcript_139226/m.388534 type:complete len:326 (+) Transcript_139226:477-1454(+)